MIGQARGGLGGDGGSGGWGGDGSGGAIENDGASFHSLLFSAVDAVLDSKSSVQKLFVHFPSLTVRNLSGNTANGGEGGTGGGGGGNGGAYLQNPGTPNPGPPISLDTPGGYGGDGGNGGRGGDAYGGAIDNSGDGFLVAVFSTVMNSSSDSGDATTLGPEIFLDSLSIILTTCRTTRPMAATAATAAMAVGTAV